MSNEQFEQTDDCSDGSPLDTVEQFNNLNQPNYYATIPSSVRYDKSLSSSAKLMYGEITALCNKKGYCWASNSYFADLYGVSKNSITSWLSALKARGHIRISTEPGISRHLYITEK